MDTHTHIHTHTHAHMCRHTHTHTHTHARARTGATKAVRMGTQFTRAMARVSVLRMCVCVCVLLLCDSPTSRSTYVGCHSVRTAQLMSVLLSDDLPLSVGPRMITRGPVGRDALGTDGSV